MKCGRCEGELLPEWGRFKWCPTCREDNAARQRDLRASDVGRAQVAKWNRTYRRKNRDTVNADRRDNYQAKKADEECIWCSAPSLPDSNWCQKHRDSHALIQRQYRARKKAA